jgi:glutathione S-transferase
MTTDVVPVLYSFRRCPYAMRARWALAVSGVQVELREVLLKDKPGEMLAASSKGTVPVLIDGKGVVIDESLDIMLWALRQHDPARWLMPEFSAFDEQLALIAQCDGEFKFNLDRYKYPERFGDANAIPYRTAAEGFIRELDIRLATRAYLFGDRMSLGDAAIAPFVRQFAQTNSTWFNLQPWPALQAWLTALITSAKFNAVMQRPKRWRPGDVPTYFPASEKS